MNEIQRMHRASGLNWSPWEQVENSVLEFEGQPRTVRIHPALWRVVVADPSYTTRRGLAVYGVPIVVDSHCPGLVVE